MFRDSPTMAEQDSVISSVRAGGGSESQSPLVSVIGVEMCEIIVSSGVYGQVRLAVDQIGNPIIFAGELFGAPPGRRLVGFPSIWRRHSKRVLRALLEVPRYSVVIADSRVCSGKQFSGAPHEWPGTTAFRRALAGRRVR
jgi:hypothetical protein